MKNLLVLEEYEVHCHVYGPEGLCGDINHIRGNQITPVGYFLANQEEASELRPKHWTVQLFMRMGLRYNEVGRTTDIVMDSLSPQWIGWHPDLPREIGLRLLREGLAAEPMALHVNRFQERGGTQFGQTWIEDEEEDFAD